MFIFCVIPKHPLARPGTYICIENMIVQTFECVQFLMCWSHKYTIKIFFLVFLEQLHYFFDVVNNNAFVETPYMSFPPTNFDSRLRHQKKKLTERLRSRLCQWVHDTWRCFRLYIFSLLNAEWSSQLVLVGFYVEFLFSFSSLRNSFFSLFPELVFGLNSKLCF